MGALVCIWVLVVTFSCGMSHAFFSGVRPNYFPGPRYDSCRETIEDLKALLEITQSLKPDTSYTCPTCTSTLSEELIIKLVNALIYTATQNCGFNGKGCGGIPVNNGGGVGGNTGIIGAANNGGGVVGGITGSGTNTALPSTGSGGGNNGLVQVGLLDDKDTAHVDVGGQKVLGVDVGKQSGSGNNAVQPSGVLPPTSGQSSDNSGLINLGVLDQSNELLGLSLGDNKVLGVDLGQGSGGAVSTPAPTDGLTKGVTQGASQGLLGGVTNGVVGGVINGALGGVTNGVLGGVTNGVLGGDNQGVSGVTQGVLGGNSPVSSGTLIPGTSNVGGVTNPVTGSLPGSSLPVNNGIVPTNIATSQVAGVSPQDPSNVGGVTNTGVLPTPVTTPINNVNSGNTQTEQNSLNVVNVINQPTATTVG